MSSSPQMVYRRLVSWQTEICYIMIFYIWGLTVRWDVWFHRKLSICQTLAEKGGLGIREISRDYPTKLSFGGLPTVQCARVGGVSYQRCWLSSCGFGTQSHFGFSIGRCFSTAKAFEQQGITPIGVYTHKNRDKASLVIKKWMGLKLRS